jgi:hypothetical protein
LTASRISSWNEKTIFFCATMNPLLHPSVLRFGFAPPEAPVDPDEPLMEEPFFFHVFRFPRHPGL